MDIIIYNINYDKLFDICINLFNKLNCSNIESDIKKGTIIGTKGLSWISFGEKIEVNIIYLEKDTYKIVISSISLFPLQIIDWNTNKNNVDVILSELKKINE